MLSAAALAVVVLAGALFGNPLDPFNTRTFSPAAWRAGPEESRARMAKSLIRRHLKRDMTASEVVALVGPPDEVLTRRMDAGGHVLPGALTYAYDLGTWSLLGLDAAFLYVHLDNADRLVSAEVGGY